MEKINSLQVMVPFKRCINNCKFCISYMNRISIDAEAMTFSKNLQDIFIDRLNLLHSNGCNNIVITGDNEPLMNGDFLLFFSNVLQALNFKFENIEIQTSGVLLDEDVLYSLKSNLNINFISLSIASLNVDVNAEIMGINRKLIYNFEKTSYEVHKRGMQLRITIILTEWFNRYQENIAALVDDILSIFSPEQITFKIIKSKKTMLDTFNWIKNHSASENTIRSIQSFLEFNAKCKSTYFGIKIYKYRNTSIMLDYDCMRNEKANEYRYLILLPNGELHNNWD